MSKAKDLFGDNETFLYKGSDLQAQYPIKEFEYYSSGHCRADNTFSILQENRIVWTQCCKLIAITSLFTNISKRKYRKTERQQLRAICILRRQTQKLIVTVQSYSRDGDQHPESPGQMRYEDYHK